MWRSELFIFNAVGVGELEMNLEREKDIQKLCEAVLRSYLNTSYDGNGLGETICPFCTVKGVEDAEMHELEHDSDCAYLIAKDLSAVQK